ncbi:MAG: ankyrin repeat domain-containing protein [Desulfovibrio sp.]|nr:ankyrin repeat domain-containing protein [Desulfovibrio sp.]
MFSEQNGIAKKLIGKGAKLDEYLHDDPEQPYFSALTIASGNRHRDYELIGMILKRGGRIDGVLCLGDDDDTTPLREAARAGDYDLFMYYVKLGAKLDQVTYYDGLYGNTAENRMFANALIGGNHKIINYLIDKGREPTFDMPFIMVKYAGKYSLDILKYMEKKGVDIAYRDEINGTIVEKLLERLLYAEDLDEQSKIIAMLKYALKKGATYNTHYAEEAMKILNSTNDQELAWLLKERMRAPR